MNVCARGLWVYDVHIYMKQILIFRNGVQVKARGLRLRGVGPVDVDLHWLVQQARVEACYMLSLSRVAWVEEGLTRRRRRVGSSLGGGGAGFGVGGQRQAGHARGGGGASIWEEM